MFKREYHLLPVEETGRPSIDTESDISSHHGTDGSDFKAIHFTFYFRIITFGLFLAAVILLRAGDYEAIPSMVFLSLAISNNFYIIFRHLISSCLVVKISLNSSGKLNKKMAKVLLVLPFVIDGLLLICLLTTLPIGHHSSNIAQWWRNRDDIKGYIVAYVALPFYLLSIMDGGKPRSVAVYFKLKLKTKGDEGRVEHHRVSARDDVEAQHQTETLERSSTDGDAVLLE